MNVIITSNVEDIKIGDDCFINCPKLAYFQYCRNNILVHDNENRFFGTAKVSGLTIIVPAGFVRPTSSGQDYINNGTTIEYNNALYRFDTTGITVENLIEDNVITFQTILVVSKNTLCECTADLSSIRFIGDVAFVFGTEGFINRTEI